MVVGSSLPTRSTGLEYPEQLHLQVERHLGDFVEEERAVVGALEHATVPALGARERPALVTEQLAFHERGRDGAAVDRDERAVATAAEVVHGARDDFLAGAALAGHEHGRRAGRDARQQREHRPHRLRAADDLAEPPGLLGVGGQLAQLTAEAARLRDLLEDVAQARDVDRLGEIVGDAAPERLDRRLERAFAGDEHDGGRRRRIDDVEQLQPLAVGQIQVQQDHVDRMPGEMGARFVERERHGDVVALLAGDGRQRGRRLLVVVDNQGFRHEVCHQERGDASRR
jgi:hypothetical protein